MLDEIRFNPPKENWNVIKYALDKGMSVGAEVPVIPEKEYVKNLEELIFYLDEIGAEFINLNEFEYCSPNSQSLKERGFKLKEGTIASVERSDETAITLIKKIAPKVKIKIHFCTIIAKDYWQLRERYLRRAKTIKLPYEEINEDGLLIFAQIEGDKIKIKEFKNILLNQLKVPRKFLSYDGLDIKLPLSFAIEEDLVKLIDQNNLKGYIVEITPFREEQYQQITEKTPIKVFKEELGFNENYHS